eukprot:356695-Chlamydomonas_euryale.AAC.2
MSADSRFGAAWTLCMLLLTFHLGYEGSIPVAQNCCVLQGKTAVRCRRKPGCTPLFAAACPTSLLSARSQPCFEPVNAWDPAVPTLNPLPL